MSLGWVMFWKGLVLAFVGILGAAWAVAVEREQATLTFRKDRKGVYRAFAPLSAVDGWWQAVKPWLRGLGYTFGFGVWAAIGGAWLWNGKEGVRSLAFWFLDLGT